MAFAPATQYNEDRNSEDAPMPIDLLSDEHLELESQVHARLKRDSIVSAVGYKDAEDLLVRGHVEVGDSLEDYGITAYLKNIVNKKVDLKDPDNNQYVISVGLINYYKNIDLDVTGIGTSSDGDLIEAVQVAINNALSQLKKK